jgi:hypothetical protein
MLVLIVGAAVLVGFTFAAVAERERGGSASPAGNTAADPQTKTLDWTEWQGRKGERIGFGVKRFQVLPNGWRARISLANESKVAFGIDPSRRSFGLMLFASGKHRDLEARNRAQTLPTVRTALAFDPELPTTLDPHATWTGTISAHGALVAGSWVRFVFGWLDVIGRAPDAFPPHLLWITDHAYRLRVPD